MLGIGDGILNTQLSALVALLFKSDTEGAFAQLKVWQSASIAVVFFVSPYNLLRRCWGLSWGQWDCPCVGSSTSPFMWKRPSLPRLSEKNENGIPVSLWWCVRVLYGHEKLCALVA
ncbi:hypothetical protein MLD38_026505 [Melastoma candidum]|uniref:Uncharacterized protein n=1 Tax=Melastoma candidum TaxID=119954 RepID=A0ACB9NZU3_9MYRT|nr:hypothetical protein MLD38_026505 [Melastoma candidum]